MLIEEGGAGGSHKYELTEFYEQKNFSVIFSIVTKSFALSGRNCVAVFQLNWKQKDVTTHEKNGKREKS